MNVLVLGNIDSKWTKNYIQYVLLPLGYTIDVLGKQQSSKYDDFYKENQITIRRLSESRRVFKRIPFIRVLSSVSNTYKNNEWREYDLIINIFVNHRDLMITSKIKRKKTRTVLYFAGSDLLRTSRFSLTINKIILPKVDCYVVGSETLLADFKVRYKKAIEPSIIHFGISAFDNIDSFLMKNNKKHNSRFVFCIGYSGTKEHQHLAVLSVFDSLPDKLKDRVELILPMTYNASDDYIKEIECKLERIGIRYKILTQFMSDEQMAQLWCEIDYFVNAQSTDSLSASVLECIYAGGVLISPSWLKYPEYNQFGIICNNYNDFEDLLNVITEVLDGTRQLICACNRQKIYESMSWESSRNKWSELIKQLFGDIV